MKNYVAAWSRDSPQRISGPSKEQVELLDKIFEPLGTHPARIVDEPLQLLDDGTLFWREFIFQGDDGTRIPQGLKKIIDYSSNGDGDVAKAQKRGQLPAGVKLEDYGLVEI